jgi:hypothetical protein
MRWNCYENRHHSNEENWIMISWTAIFRVLHEMGFTWIHVGRDITPNYKCKLLSCFYPVNWCFGWIYYVTCQQMRGVAHNWWVVLGKLVTNHVTRRDIVTPFRLVNKSYGPTNHIITIRIKYFPKFLKPSLFHDMVQGSCSNSRFLLKIYNKSILKK